MWAEGRAGGGGPRRAATPSHVLRALVKGNRWFAGNGQHDAHEALRSILDLLHEELRRPVSGVGWGGVRGVKDGRGVKVGRVGRGRSVKIGRWGCRRGT